jgi:hypothetical protein
MISFHRLVPAALTVILLLAGTVTAQDSRPTSRKGMGAEGYQGMPRTENKEKLTVEQEERLPGQEGRNLKGDQGKSKAKIKKGALAKKRSALATTGGEEDFSASRNAPAGTRNFGSSNPAPFHSRLDESDASNLFKGGVHRSNQPPGSLQKMSFWDLYKLISEDNLNHKAKKKLENSLDN